MSNTPNNQIPYVPEGTLNPAAGLNDAIDVIDALLQTAVIAMDLSSPPGTPIDGDMYIVKSPGAGAWTGLSNYLVRYREEGAFWQSYAPGTQSKMVLNLDDGKLYIYDATNSPVGWHEITGTIDQTSDYVWSGKHKFANAKTIFTASDYVANVPSLSEAQLDAIASTGPISTMSEHSFRCIRESSPNFTGVAWGAPMSGPQAAATSGDILVTLRGDGYDGTGDEGDHFEAGEVQVIASENWNGSSHGAYLSFKAIPNGQTTLIELLRMYSDNTDTFFRIDQGQWRINMDGTNRFRFTNVGGGGAGTSLGLQDSSGTDKGFFSIADAASSFISGSAAGDACLRAQQELFLGAGGGSAAAKFDNSSTAGQTRAFIYDVDNGQLERITVGAADSGGSGFKLLRIAN